MDTQNYQETVKRHLREFNATLPADLPEAERRQRLIQELHNITDADMIQIAGEMEGILSTGNDAITLLKAETDQQKDNDQLAQVRQGL